MVSKSQVLVILGPTASGKSDLAVRLAQEFAGEVLSADSRQVYRGLDIGSGKITAAEMAGIPHYLLDVADPHEQFSATEYQKLAQAKIDEILARGKLPILCGGTGLYLRAVVDDLVLPAVPPNPARRRELERLSSDDLFRQLSRLDPAYALKIDRHNRRRLVRALEIVETLGAMPPLAKRKSKYQFIQIGINPPPAVLREKIKIRLAKRLDSGLVDEVAALQAGGLSWDRLEALGLEYRYVARFLQHKITREQLEKELELAIWHYAKRQLTWFKRDERIQWFPHSSAAADSLLKTGLGRDRAAR